MQLANIYKHLKKILVHKYWVARYCFKASLYWQGITHDLSKFSPTEFIESVEYYQGDRSPIDACKEDKGYSLAWLHHRGRNPHHYEYWVDNFDKCYAGEPLTLLEMPYKYVLEMLCDYLGAGRAYYGESFSYKKEYDWWKNFKQDNCAMAIHTKCFIASCLYTMAQENSCKCLSDKVFLKKLYNIRYEENKP